MFSEVAARRAVWMDNYTASKVFQIVPFFFKTEYKLYVFGILLIIYFTCLFINIIIITVIYIDDHLHIPMYLFLCNLSVVDICFTTVTVPKLLHMILTNNNTISFTQCFTQFCFYVLFGTSEDVLLFIMAYDRYVAICKPLHYNQILGRKNCLMLIAGTWISACTNSLLITKAVSAMSFCRSKVINQLFCDIKALLKISCTGTEMFFMLIYLEFLLLGFVPFLCIVMSYVKIIAIILNINSRDGRRKVFSTCSSHLTVILLFYANEASVVLIEQSRYSEVLEQICTVLYTAVTPMLNPLIYTIRNKEVKSALMRLLGVRVELSVNTKGVVGFKFKSAIKGSGKMDTANNAEIMWNISFQNSFTIGQIHQTWRCDPRSVQSRKHDEE
ncbi:olfactory receptor 1500-like [Aquarana catesbeiana]|uniref:olfactory receptor 1500-like n=1 Tax=Aquarana catesbeiana TaxID=8400 RepID=UPI003CC95086